MAEKVTSIVLHYKRPQNVSRWIEGIRSQTVESEIIVWDQSGEYRQGSGEDVLIRSTKNYNCLPRVLCGGLASHDWIWNQDDDMAINDKNLFEKLIEEGQKHPYHVIGWNGRDLSQCRNWEKPYWSPAGGFVDAVDSLYENINVDIINFGISFYRRDLINELVINPFEKFGISPDDYRFADDIIASKQWKKKRTVDFLMKSLDRLEEGEALSKQSGHMPARDKWTKIFYEKIYKEG